MSREELRSIKNQTVERVNSNTSCYRWKINGFSQCPREVLSCIVSPTFKIIDSKVIWRLKLYPNGKMGGSNFMTLDTGYYSSINTKAYVELSIMNVDNKIIKAFAFKQELQLKAPEIKLKSKTYSYAGSSHFNVKRSDVEAPGKRILANDCLTISFNVTFHDPIVKLPNSCENSDDYVKGIRPNRFDDFGHLLENGKYSDVKFVVGEKEILVHKAILASRSPVFDAMFRNEMQENKNNEVVIVDAEYAVMKELFRFIYTDMVANIELMASDLLIAAEKYCIERLKALCEKSLLNNLSVDNVLERLVRAEQCNLANLKKQILEFIVKNSNRVVEKGELASLPQDLMCEIIRAMAPKVNAH